MLDNISEARLQDINPVVANLARSMATLLEADGIKIRVTQGLRSWNEQEALYRQGRDSDGLVIKPELVVTNAQAGHSFHCFGLAFDVCPIMNNVADWNVHHPNWSRIIAIGISVGLVSGSSWRSFPDWPHFQAGPPVPASPTDEDRQLFIDGGMQTVWEHYNLVPSV